MIRKIKCTVACILLVLGTATISAQTSKSKTANTPSFVIHVVKFGETLSKIAKQYEVSQTDILRINPSLTANNLSPQQIIRIPNMNGKKKLTRSEISSNELLPKQKEEVKASLKNKKIHIVQPGQTLYAISKIYGVKVEDIQKWNNLYDNNVNVGTVLVVDREIQKPIVEKAVQPEVDKKMMGSSIAPTSALPTEQLVTDEFMSAAQDTEKPDVQAADNETQKELLQIFKQRAATRRVASVRGTGAPMTTTLGTMERVYFAMHKTLPVGTVVKIKNLVNSKIIYAKVIGKLPDSDENKHVIVRYSLGVKIDLQLQNGKCYVQIEYPE